MREPAQEHPSEVGRPAKRGWRERLNQPVFPRRVAPPSVAAPPVPPPAPSPHPPAAPVVAAAPPAYDDPTARLEQLALAAPARREREEADAALARAAEQHRLAEQERRVAARQEQLRAESLDAADRLAAIAQRAEDARLGEAPLRAVPPPQWEPVPRD